MINLLQNKYNELKASKARIFASISLKSIYILLIFLLAIPGVVGTLHLSALAPSEADVCANATFAVYANSTESPDSKISLNITMPEGFAYNSGSARISYPVGNFSAQEPVIFGHYLNWTNSSWILASGQFLKIQFKLTAGCGAPSGKRLAVNGKSSSGPATPFYSTSIIVNQGLLKVTKEPNVIEAGKWDIVNWAVKIENLGTGPAFNVKVNDTPCEGLELLSINSLGGGLNWSYKRIDPGQAEEVTAVFRVIGCENLINEVNVSWGCGDSCQETYAKGSVKFIPRTPDVVYTFSPSPIVVPYCNNTSVKVDLENLGLGNATNLTMVLSEFSAPYRISNVTGAVYHQTNHTFCICNIPPAAEKNFSFDFGMSHGDCGSKGASGVFNVQVFYNDDCGNPWYPPISQVHYSMNPSTIPQITVSKIGDEILYLGETGEYTLGVIYSRGGCDLHSLPYNTIVDRYPESFEVADSAGGSVNQSAHTITWTNQAINDTAPWSRTILLNATRNSTVCNCGNIYQNEFSVNASQDCCNCPLSANTSLAVLVECFNQTVLSFAGKTAQPLAQENCRNITYITTYIFNNTTGLTWSDLNFTETGNNFQTFPDGSYIGNATFVLNDNCMNESTITLGSPKNLSFLEAGCGPLSSGDRLNISYTLRQPRTGSFVDWSALCIKGYDSGCAGVSCSQVGVAVNVARASYDLSITGTDRIVSPCMAFNLTLNLIKTSPDQDPYWLGHDMYLTFNQNAYRYIGPARVTGIDNYPSGSPSPVPVIAGNNVTWFLGKNVSRSGNITFLVEKRCPLVKGASAALNYTDNCGLPQLRAATANPSLLTQGDIIIQKNPEVVYALDRNASWKIYVINKGAGTAFNVTVYDQLDRDLNYTGSRISRCQACPLVPEPANTTVIDAGQCGPDRVIWKLGNLSPKQQAVIEMNAKLCGCENRKNTVYAVQGCGGSECQNVTDSSRVELVNSKMLVSRHEAGLVDECGENASFLIEVRNAGPVRVYNLSIEELLPAGLKLNGTPTVTGLAPTWSDITGSPLIWRFNQSTGIAPGTRILLKFNATVTGPCAFDGGISQVNVNYIEPCGRYGPELESRIQVFKASPLLVISKTPTFFIADKANFINWTITISSVGDYEAKNVSLYDVLPEGTSFHSAIPLNDRGSGTPADPLVWDLANMTKGSKTIIYLNATATQCHEDEENNASVLWGCCSPRKSSTAKAKVRTSPAISISSKNDSVDTCGGNYTITITNLGSTAYVADITDHLPVGFLYQMGSSNISSSLGRTFAKQEPTDYSSINGTIIWNSSNIERINANEIIDIKFKIRNSPNSCGIAATSLNELSNMLNRLWRTCSA
jgi:uncharacterized repeat protein (TIGR01451 family)